MGLKKNANELQADINALKNDINSVDDLEKTLAAILESNLNDLTKNCKDCVNGSKQTLDKNIRALFGKQLTAVEKELEDERIKKEKALRTGKFFDIFTEKLDTIFNPYSEYKKNRDTVSKDMDCGTKKGDSIEFFSAQAAQQFIDSGSNAVGAAIKDVQEVFTQFIDNAKSDYSVKAEKLIREQAEPLFKKIESRIQKSGYNINLTLPDFNQLELQVSANSRLDVGVKRETKTTRVKQSGFRGGVKRFFGWFCNESDWGYKDETREYYPVNLATLLQAAEKAVNAWVEEVEKTLESHISDEIKEKQRQYFEEMKRTLEEMRGDLIVAQSQKSKSQAEQNELLRYIDECKKN